MNILAKYIENLSLRSCLQNLYRLEVLHTTLSLLIQGKLSFKIEKKRFSESRVGLCTTSTQSIYNKITNKHIICIKKIAEDVIIHEIAHAMEKESGLDINNGFKPAVLLDLQHLESGNIILNNTIQKLTIEGIKAYPIKSHIPEIFARYFQLFSYTKEISPWGKFSVKTLQGAMRRTNKWVQENLEPILKKKILPEVTSFWEDKNVVQNKFNWQSKTPTKSKPWMKRASSLFDEK